MDKVFKEISEIFSDHNWQEEPILELFSKKVDGWVDTLNRVKNFQESETIKVLDRKVELVKEITFFSVDYTFICMVFTDKKYNINSMFIEPHRK